MGSGSYRDLPKPQLSGSSGFSSPGSPILIGGNHLQRESSASAPNLSSRCLNPCGAWGGVARAPGNSGWGCKGLAQGSGLGGAVGRGGPARVPPGSRARMREGDPGEQVGPGGWMGQR